MNIIKWFKRLKCRLNLCSGHVEHFKDKDGVWWLGLKCSNGVYHSPIKSEFQDPPKSI